MVNASQKAEFLYIRGTVIVPDALKYCQPCYDTYGFKVVD